MRALNILQQRTPNMTPHPHTQNMMGGTGLTPLPGSQCVGQGQGLPPYPSRGGTREDARTSERTRQREGREGGKDAAIVSTIDGIDSKMSDLKSLFRKGDPQERRTKAATKSVPHSSPRLFSIVFNIYRLSVPAIIFIALTITHEFCHPLHSSGSRLMCEASSPGAACPTTSQRSWSGGGGDADTLLGSLI